MFSVWECSKIFSTYINGHGLYHAILAYGRFHEADFAFRSWGESTSWQLKNTFDELFLFSLGFKSVSIFYCLLCVSPASSLIVQCHYLTPDNVPRTLQYVNTVSWMVQKCSIFCPHSPDQQKEIKASCLISNHHIKSFQVFLKLLTQYFSYAV